MKLVFATRLVVATLILGVSMQANAAGFFYSGNDIVRHCSDNRAMISGFAAGAFDKANADMDAYLRYAIDMVDDPQKTGEQQQKTKDESYFANRSVIRGYCAPNGITLGQVSDIFCQFLIANPAKRQISAIDLFNQALSNAWPCPEK
jgi:Rap1a immunity proteins